MQSAVSEDSREQKNGWTEEEAYDNEEKPRGSEGRLLCKLHHLERTTGGKTTKEDPNIHLKQELGLLFRSQATTAKSLCCSSSNVCVALYSGISAILYCYK